MRPLCNAPAADGRIPCATEFPCCLWIKPYVTTGWRPVAVFKSHARTKLPSEASSGRSSRFNRRFYLECSQVVGEGGPEIRALQSKFHRSFQEAELVSGIVPFALKGI